MGVHGIISYGAYIPRGCLLRSSIVEFTGKGSNKGSRSIASYDENTTTMGVEAARNAGEIIFGRENANNWQSSAGGAASYIAFKTNSSGTHAERLRIDSIGRVIVTDGSNNNSYNNKLMVLGAATNTATGTGSYAVMGVGDTNSQQSGRGGGIAFHGNDGVNTQVTLAQIQGYKENSYSGDYAGGFRIHTRVGMDIYRNFKG